MAVTIIWRGDTPQEPNRTTGPTFDDVERQLRASPWAPKDPIECRRHLAFWEKCASGNTVPIGGTSEQFLTALAHASNGRVKIIQTA